jgi:hypothetical protein
MAKENLKFIQELALDISKRYKQEGFHLTPGIYYRMAREAFEEMEEDFE